jgi:UDP-N-acetylmuramate--alanine ligase
VAKLTLSAIKAVHFIGVGGIGVSALARLFLAEGKKVTGSDRAPSLITAELSKLGVEIRTGVGEADLVIYTIAVPSDHPELLEARQRHLPTLSYPEALGELSREKYTIAVAGTHGKTTTTAMIAEVLIRAGLDPTVIVGSLFTPPNQAAASPTNFIAGRSKYFVVEACEYRRSFLHLSPQVLVITNIDADHLDYYRDLADIQSAFAALVAKVPPDGAVITAKEYEQISLPITLRVPGRHNQQNAQAAIAVAKTLGLSEVVARQHLANFRGTWRRFELKGETSTGALVYDDYAHHPAEISATLQGARELYPERPIIAVFQPHLYSRTKQLLADFAAALSGADEVVLLPIYAAREPFDPRVSSELLATAIGEKGTAVRTLPDFVAARDYLLGLPASRPPLLIIMGAGDITELAGTLVFGSGRV